MERMGINEDLHFYAGKTVLVTGHTGFKGSWLCQILLKAGASVTGYALGPPTSPSLLPFAACKTACTTCAAMCGILPISRRPCAPAGRT